MMGRFETSVLHCLAILTSRLVVLCNGFFLWKVEKLISGEVL